MISDFEKVIYNKHLSIFKKNQNKPFSYRKNFDNLDESTVFYLKKLSMFFSKFKNINVDSFFSAPYLVYKDEKFFDLKFYISPKALKTYTLYKKSLDQQDPDSDNILQKTFESIKHIKKVCNENNLKSKDFINFVAPGNTIPEYIICLQNQNVNMYSLLGFDNFKTSFLKNYETYKYILGDLADKYNVYYNNFIKSKKLKVLVREGIKKIY